jgi:RNA polymerase sigma-70 factor, ECF subfamily
MPERSDQDLIGALARGEVSGLEELYDRYKRVAYSLAYRILGERGAAEDVLQEAFLSVWRQAGSYKPERGNVRTWLMSVVHHRSIDRLRAAASSSGSVPLDELPDSPTDEPGVWQQVWAGFRGDLVRTALDDLPTEQRKSIELAYFSGYTQAQIAELMGVPLGTVKGRLRLGLLKIKSFLEGQQFEAAT